MVGFHSCERAAASDKNKTWHSAHREACVKNTPLGIYAALAQALLVSSLHPANMAAMLIARTRTPSPAPHHVNGRRRQQPTGSSNTVFFVLSSGEFADSSGDHSSISRSSLTDIPEVEAQWLPDLVHKFLTPAERRINCAADTRMWRATQVLRAEEGAQELILNAITTKRPRPPPEEFDKVPRGPWFDGHQLHVTPDAPAAAVRLAAAEIAAATPGAARAFGARPRTLRQLWPSYTSLEEVPHDYIGRYLMNGNSYYES